MATVPNVVGRTQADATAAIEAEQLRVSSIYQVFEPPALGPLGLGRVLSQDPASGSSVGPDSLVNLVISGPAVVLVDVISDLKAVPNQGVDATRTTTVVVLGYNARGDGGGGIFEWVQASPPVEDDGGTVFLPASPPGQPQSPHGPGYWKRIYSGPLNVKWFGAKGDGIHPDDPAINKAINVAAATTAAAGGAVYVPAGDYYITSSVILPRNKAILLFGDGMYVSSLRARKGFARNSPVLTFDNTSASPVYHKLMNIRIARDTPGRVFTHEQPTGNERLTHATFENVYFKTGIQNDTFTEQPCVSIAGALQCSFTDIVIGGGDPGLHFQNCSYVNINNLSSDFDYSMKNGLCIEGGGSFTINHVHMYSMEDGGYAVSLHGGAADISFNGLMFENKTSTRLISIEDAERVTIVNACIASPSKCASGGRYGIYCGAASRAVRIIGGIIGDYSYLASSSAIKVVSGAREIAGEGIVHKAGLSQALSNVVVDSDAQLVNIHLLTGTNSDDTARVRAGVAQGVIGTMSPTGGPVSIRDYDTWRVSYEPGFNTLIDGYAGQTITILFTGLTVVGNSGNIRLLGNASYTFAANTVLRLLFDGTAWWEISRSAD